MNPLSPCQSDLPTLPDLPTNLLDMERACLIIFLIISILDNHVTHVVGPREVEVISIESLASPLSFGQQQTGEGLSTFLHSMHLRDAQYHGVKS